MNKFDKYYIGKNIKIKTELMNKIKNKYFIYEDIHKNNNILISNGISILKVNEIPKNFSELNEDFVKETFIKYFEKCNDTYNYNYSLVKTYDKTEYKNSILTKSTENKWYKLDEVEEFVKKFTLGYTSVGIDIVSLKKIVDIIGLEKINIATRNGNWCDDSIIIEIIGKNNQVGYLLPCVII